MLLLSPVGTIELAELDGLQQLGGSEDVRERLVGMCCCIEISDGTCDFEDAIVGTRRQAVELHCRAQVLLGLCVGLAVLTHHAWRHLSVAVDGCAAETFCLDGARFAYALTDSG